MGLDFYGIEISARIRVPYKLSAEVGAKVGFREYNLWVDDGIPNALKTLAYVQDVSIQIGLGLNSKVSLTLTPPMEEGLELIHSELLSWGGSELKVRIGYSTGDNANRLSMEFGGLMMKPDVHFGPNTTITLNALGVAYGLNLSSATDDRSYPPGTSPWGAVRDSLIRNTRVSIGTDAEVFPDLTPDQMNSNSPNAHPFFKPIIGKKASTPSEQADAEKKKAAVRASVASKAITKQEGDNQIAQIDSNIRREDEKLSINKGPRNDWWFIRETVTRYGLDIVIRDTSVVIREPQKWKLGQPRYQFVLKGNIDTDAKVPVYPILEFSSPSSYVWLGQGSGGGLLADVSPDKKEEIEKLQVTIAGAKREDKSQKAPSKPVSFRSGGVVVTSGKGASAQLKRLVEPVPISRTGQGAYNSAGGGPDAYQVFPGSPEDSRADQVAGELRNYNNNRGIQADVTSIGIPQLLPADIVALDGLAPEAIGSDQKKAWFNGNYGVMTVEHHIGTAGMTTKFKGVKNFFPGEMLGGVSSESAMGGQVNKSTVESTSVPTSDTVTRTPSDRRRIGPV